VAILALHHLCAVIGILLNEPTTYHLLHTIDRFREWTTFGVLLFVGLHVIAFCYARGPDAAPIQFSIRTLLLITLLCALLCSILAAAGVF